MWRASAQIGRDPSEEETPVMAKVTRTISTTTLLLMLVMISVLVGSVEAEKGSKGTYSGRVLLVSMDGFRADYLQKVSGLANFSRLAKSGCTVDYMQPSFATKTFPCHYTIVTGLYQESHGILSNRMYDPVQKIYFTKRSRESFWWDGGEPIWITAEKQNKRTGTYFWVGSETEIRGYRPSLYIPYNESVPFPERVRTALQWLKTGGKDFVTLYFHEPDATGHQYGPDSQEVADKVREMDGVLGLILNSMEEMQLNDVNVIITSDHGMTSVDVQTRLLDLWDYLNQSMVDVVPDSGIVTPILPKAGMEQEVLTAALRIPNVKVYRKEDIPQDFHYKNNIRIMPIVILSNEGWLLSSRAAEDRTRNRKGDHGYSNQLPSMQTIFLARGPDFRKGIKSTSIRSVDIYPLMCRLLNIQPAPNNGSLANTAQFLVNPGNGVGRLIATGTVEWIAVGLFVSVSKRLHIF